MDRGPRVLGLRLDILNKAYRGVSENWGTLFGGPYNKDPTI